MQGLRQGFSRLSWGGLLPGWLSACTQGRICVEAGLRFCWVVCEEFLPFRLGGAAYLCLEVVPGSV
jgi:hypothetical protein